MGKWENARNTHFAFACAWGNGQMGNDPRWLQANGIKNLMVINNDITYTRGINLGECASGATIRITKNYHHNIQGAGGPGSGAVGNFIQLQVVTQASSIEIDWNQIINEYNLSYPEDIISCYFSSKMYCHDNYLQHQSKPGNTSGSSQNSITMEGDARINNTRVEYNQVVDAFGIAIFLTALPGTPHDNILLGNRIIGDRLLPNGSNKANGWGSPLGIKSGVGPQNHAHSNVVGYVSYDGSRQTLASNLPGAQEGAVAEAANNTYLADPAAKDKMLYESALSFLTDKYKAHLIESTLYSGVRDGAGDAASAPPSRKTLRNTRSFDWMPLVPS